MKNRSQKIMRISTVTALAVWAVLMVLLFRNMGSVSLHELLTYQPEKPVLAALSMLLLFALKSMDAVIHCGVLFAATGLMLPLPYAFAVNMLGVVLMSVIPYFVGIQLGTDAADSLRQKHPRLRELRQLRSRNELFLSFLIRIIGILPCDVVSLYLGNTRMPYWKYLLGGVLGFMADILTATVVGMKVEDRSSPWFWGAIAVNLLVAGGSTLFYYFYRKRHGDEEAPVAEQSEE